MVELYRLRCVTCHTGDPSLSDHDILRWHRETPQWEVKQVDGIRHLERVFIFKSFAEAIAFTTEVAKLAVQEKHHPFIVIDYDEVTLKWWTHKVQGLHLNDFIMAAKVDSLIRSNPPR